jgi:hypothetical protein
VLDLQRPVAERSADPLGLALKEHGPVGVVCDEDDRPGRRWRVADQRRAKLTLGSHPVASLLLRAAGVRERQAAASSSACSAPSIIVAATISNAPLQADSYSGFQSSPAIAAIDAISVAPTTG